MKQKLGIAQVLMENPDVMILDEVFNGLDDSSCKTIRELLLSEVKKGKIIILATHIKDDIEILCDEVYKIDNKKILKIK
jgi:ABC-2 type transport system ATP-binding protein